MRSQVVELIESGEPFQSMEFITADRRRGTGGQWVRVEGWAKKVGQPVEDTMPGKIIRQKSLQQKDPDHYRHGTFNIYNPGNKVLHIHKVHTVLIQTFNGKKVVNG